MRTLIVAVGRLRPPYQDDVQHYRKMLGRYAKIETIVLRDEERVTGRLPAEAVERVDVAGPGFLNLFMSDVWYRDAAARIVDAGGSWGSGRADPAERVLVEFVSANPTGPVTVASGRNAAYGDGLARLLEFAGHVVEREYYVNDYGTQIENFGLSIKARARGEEPPEDGYRGGYVAE